ncbi:uncharacterized protein LOC143238622 [Tachypleus tridentatus]|uniref:uncharacterized protein LOC143238622 n=1 Tax=Tachypleus tridentatus TaxID=6853 RepID=UPI003FD13DDB
MSSHQSFASNTTEEELSSGNGKKYDLRRRKEISYVENSVKDDSKRQFCYTNSEQIDFGQNQSRKLDMEKCDLNKESSSGFLTSGNPCNVSELNYNLNEKEDSFLMDKENKPVNIKQLGKRSYQKLHHPNLRKTRSISETKVGYFDDLLSGKCTWSYKNCKPDNINKLTNEQTQENILMNSYNLSEGDSDTEYVLQSRQDLEKKYKDILKCNKHDTLNTQTEKEIEGINNVVQKDKNASSTQLDASEEKSFHNSLEPLQKSMLNKFNKKSRKERFDKVKNDNKKEKMCEAVTIGKESRDDIKNKITDYHNNNYDFEMFGGEIELQDLASNVTTKLLNKQKRKNCSEDKKVFAVILKQNDNVENLKLPVSIDQENNHHRSNENVDWKIWHENGDVASTRRPEKIYDTKENKGLYVVEETLSCNLKNSNMTEISKKENYGLYSVYSPHFSDNVEISEASDFELSSTPESERHKPEHFANENVEKNKERKKDGKTKKEISKDSSEASGMTSARGLTYLDNENDVLESFTSIELEHEKESQISETTFSEKSKETDYSHHTIDTLPIKSNLTPVIISNKISLSPVLASLRFLNKVESTIQDVNTDLLNGEEFTEFVDREKMLGLKKEAITEHQSNLLSINELFGEESASLNDSSISSPVAERCANTTFVCDIISRLRQICSPLKISPKDSHLIPISPLDNVKENALLDEDSDDHSSSNEKDYPVLNKYQQMKGMNEKREEGTLKATLTLCGANVKARNEKVQATFTAVQRGNFCEDDYKSTCTISSHQLSLPSKEDSYSYSEEVCDYLSPFLDEDVYLEHQNKLSQSENTPPVTQNYLVSSEQELSVLSTTVNEGEKGQNSYVDNSVTMLKESNYKNISTEKTYKEDTITKQTQVCTDEKLYCDKKEEDDVFSLPSSCEELFPVSNLPVKEDILVTDAGNGLLCDFFEKGNLKTESSTC